MEAQPGSQIVKSSSTDNVKQPLHSILVNGNTDDDFFKVAKFRPRANTEPTPPKPKLRVHFDLPDIVVDDCSDNEQDVIDTSRPEEINKELANTAEGAFFVFKSPPRQRSNTCPINMFGGSKPRKNRPPTPPPKDRIPQGNLQRYPSWEKVDFAPHTLCSVEEAKEINQDNKPSGSELEHRSRRSSANKHVKPRSSIPASDSPSGSPKRTHVRLSNGHVAHKTGNAIDITS
ncbi:uncharacterized protein LOC127858004 isoform X2 [Dreissena polymorpha]|uniref:Uncharacterized protein n=1 Tax=Dreissena polymorpha TaxID=45954 RepID=A0A9D3YSH5_DREPO|nr:uncharacterized protein LOC127858004 isoform X2 [Dreissena polymorpha]KAH3706515.1 hypothetical protein DPMN_065902 [Dreissena polymorpha]